MFQAIARRLRGWGVRLAMLRKGGRVASSTALGLDRGASVRFGKRSVVRGFGSIFLAQSATLEIGGGTSIMQGCEIFVAKDARLTIGANVYVGAYCNIRCSREITIGENVRLAQFVSLIDANYSFANRQVPIGETVPESVTIGEGAWIGAQTVVLPSVEVGQGAVVGAGSVVTKSVPAFAIVAGNPARVLRFRG